MNYYKIPENILENREELLLWINKSLKVESKTKTKPKIKTLDLTKKVLNYIKTIPD
jgi:TfoX/Sxy family transcriptional regulator of competence genes